MAGFAGAKVNLYLHVGPLGADGYHPIDSLMVFADVGDQLSVTPSGFTASGPFAAAAPMSPSNLALRAALILAPEAGFGLHLEKNLPVAAGIGGGSADAAAALRLVNAHLGLGLDDAALCKAGLELGADVPACVRGHALVARGRGERLGAAPWLPALDAVLVNPGVATPTASVFAAFDAAAPSAGRLSPEPPPSFDSVGGLTDWLARETRNDLEAPARALVPAVGEAIDLVAASSLALLTRMSGSGATVFALCAGRDQAAALARSVRAARPGWWVQVCRLA